jgi:hypothetical protein
LHLNIALRWCCMPHFGRTLCAAIVAGLVVGSGVSARADSPNHGSSPALRQDAHRALPLTRLTPHGKSLSSRVLNDVTIFRRLPTQVIESDPEMFTFLVDHPDLVINIWEVMGLTKVVLKRTGPHSFHIDDGNGTSGDIHYLYRSPAQTLVYCEGVYTGSMVPRPIRGRCILSLRCASVRDADSRDLIQCRLDSFLQLDNVGAEMFARTFQNLIGGIADHNFRETTGFAQGVSKACETTPENIQRIAAKLHRVTPEERQQFCDLGMKIATRGDRTPPTAGGPALPGVTGPSAALPRTTK